MSELNQLESIQDKCFEKLLSLIHELTGITIHKNRKSMVLGRLRKRALALGLDSYESYCERVSSSAAEKAIFIDLMTTNETYFYRTPRIWSHVLEKFLPQWIENNRGKTFQAWSAAASSGEEAHTLAVLLHSFRQQHPAFQYQILGTDISNEMIERCQEGRYRGRSVESFRNARPDLWSRYFRENEPGDFSVIPEIKQRIRFKRHNLFQSLPDSISFDLILLRNVLIYFNSQDQARALSLIRPKLDSKGILVIGESESLAHIKTDFASVEPLIYRVSPLTAKGSTDAA